MGALDLITTIIEFRTPPGVAELVYCRLTITVEERSFDPAPTSIVLVPHNGYTSVVDRQLTIKAEKRYFDLVAALIELGPPTCDAQPRNSDNHVAGVLRGHGAKN